MAEIVASHHGHTTREQPSNILLSFKKGEDDKLAAEKLLFSRGLK